MAWAKFTLQTIALQIARKQKRMGAVKAGQPEFSALDRTFQKAIDTDPATV